MDIITHTQGYAHEIYVVRLTTEEARLSDMDLISYVDNKGKSLDRHHFGGTVERRKGKHTDAIYARVKVYID